MKHRGRWGNIKEILDQEMVLIEQEFRNIASTVSAFVQKILYITKYF
jgi:hypothetical protein